MDLEDFTARERRLAILRLMRDGGGMANERSIYNAMKPMGYPLTTRDDVTGDLDILAARSCITTETHEAGFLVATLTGLGRDVADGKRQVKDVKKGDPADAL